MQPLMNILKAFLGLLASFAGQATGAVRRGRTFRYNAKVARWADDADQVQREVGTSCHISYRDVLSIIQVESEGNPKAHRPGSQFYGLTQVGRAVAKETKTDRRKMATDPHEAIRAFCRWAKKYRHLHDWDPELMALGWKGGVGTLDTYNNRLRAGEDLDDLRKWLDKSRWGTWKYVRKFKAAQSIWHAQDPKTAPAVTVR